MGLPLPAKLRYMEHAHQLDWRSALQIVTRRHLLFVPIMQANGGLLDAIYSLAGDTPETVQTIILCDFL